MTVPLFTTKMIEFNFDDVRRPHELPFDPKANGHPIQRGFLVSARLRVGEDFDYWTNRIAVGHDPDRGKLWPDMNEVKDLEDEMVAEIRAKYAEHLHDLAACRRFILQGGSFRQYPDISGWFAVLPNGTGTNWNGTTRLQAFLELARHSAGQYGRVSA